MPLAQGGLSAALTARYARLLNQPVHSGCGDSQRACDFADGVACSIERGDSLRSGLTRLAHL